MTNERLTYLQERMVDIGKNISERLGYKTESVKDKSLF
ncbi:IclR family transcriptional regulator, partial [Priestia megaterium]